MDILSPLRQAQSFILLQESNRTKQNKTMLHGQLERKKAVCCLFFAGTGRLVPKAEPFFFIFSYFPLLFFPLISAASPFSFWTSVSPFYLPLLLLCLSRSSPVLHTRLRRSLISSGLLTGLLSWPGLSARNAAGWLRGFVGLRFPGSLICPGVPGGGVAHWAPKM